MSEQQPQQEPWARPPAGDDEGGQPAVAQTVGAVAVDPRRARRRVVFGSAAAAVIVAALGVAVATAGGPATETSAVASDTVVSTPATDAPSTGSDPGVGSSSDPFGGSSDATNPDAGSSDQGYGWGGPRAGRGFGAFPGGGDGQTTQTTAVAATAAQQTGVVTIVAQLGYENATSAGTGMILSSDGLVLTNNHVVEGATAITVTDESTGQEYTATVLGTDATSDIALLQLDGASGLTPVTLDDDVDGVVDGSAVTAVGNAEGTGDLVAAAGTVTDTDQTMTASTEQGGQGETLSGLIEFEADVVAGDSGGPLLDDEGEVVGMTTAASTGPGTTTAYAIDISDALTIAGQIESGTGGDGVTLGYPAFLGVWFSAGTSFGVPSSDGASGAFGASGSYGSSDGALIAGVLDGTPAAAAGLAAGDVITAVDGTAVSSSSDLSAALDAHQPGDTVTITWVSGTTGATSSAAVTLVAGPVD